MGLNYDSWVYHQNVQITQLNLHLPVTEL
uniref:Uncharacterized protein n=1 Tax=Anguilla anguilla TaxID=7936 RepID=A0A0E9Y1S2_ANGAN